MNVCHCLPESNPCNSDLGRHVFQFCLATYLKSETEQTHQINPTLQNHSRFQLRLVKLYTDVTISTPNYPGNQDQSKNIINHCKVRDTKEGLNNHKVRDTKEGFKTRRANSVDCKEPQFRLDKPTQAGPECCG